MAERVRKGTATIGGAVLAALARRAGVEESEIELDGPLAAIPGIDSLMVLRAMADVEDECGVVVPDDVLFQARTVAQLIEFISLAEQQP